MDSVGAAGSNSLNRLASGIYALLGLSMLASCALPAIEASQPGEPTVAYIGATLIDGVSSTPLADAVIVTRGEKIIAVGSNSEVTVPSGAKVIDASGKFITPGLVDAHTHFMESGRVYTMPGVFDLTSIVPYDEEIAWIRNRLPQTFRAYICAGVTSNVSAGGPKLEYDARALARTMAMAPNVIVAHGPISLVQSSSIFPPIEGDTAVRTATTTEEGRARVTEAAEWGADLIKTGYLGGPFGSQETDYLAVHRAIIEEAHARDFKVTTHVTEVEPARALIALGVDSIQHMPSDKLIDDAFVKLAIEHGTIFVPTLDINQRLNIEVRTEMQLEPIEQRCGDPAVIASWSEVTLPPPPVGFLDTIQAEIKRAITNLRKLYAAGVPIAAGTDSGLIGLLHGASMHLELKLLSQAGLSNMDVIKAGTINSARVAGQQDRIGSVEAGKLADFIILSADPLDDIANLQAIETVVKGGVAFDENALSPVSAHGTDLRL